MLKKKQDLVEIIFQKLKKNSVRKIKLEKKEFTEFVNYLMSNKE